MNSTALLKKIKVVNGYLCPREPELLFTLAKQCKGKGVIVEIGSWQGKSTICLGLGSLEGEMLPIYAIDPHEGILEGRNVGKQTLESFKKNIQKAGITSIVTPLVMTSHNAVKKVKKPIELLFIDGAHDYKSVKQDFENWFPKVIDGGVIAFHDTVSWVGPGKVVREDVLTSRKFKNTKVVGSITYATKVKRNSTTDVLSNYYVLLTKIVRQFVVQAALPKPLHNLAKRIYYRIQ